MHFSEILNLFPHSLFLSLRFTLTTRSLSYCFPAPISLSIVHRLIHEKHWRYVSCSAVDERADTKQIHATTLDTGS